MLDVRFLPNPHYEPELRPLTGDDPRIVEFINRDGELDAFYERLHPLLDYLLPQYLAEGKAHLVVGDRLHRRTPPLGGDRRASRRRATAARARTWSRSCTATSTSAARDRPRRLRGLRPGALGPLLRRPVLRARGAADARVRARGRLRDQRARDLDRRARPPAGARLRPPGAAGQRQGGGRRRPRRRAGQRRQRRRAARPAAAVRRGATTPATCAIPTACGSRSSRADSRVVPPTGLGSLREPVA